jgi:hypothetical protein
MPALEKAVDRKEDGKVVSVFSAGQGKGRIDMDDLGLVRKFSLGRAASHAATYNDLMMEVSLSEQHIFRKHSINVQFHRNSRLVTPDSHLFMPTLVSFVPTCYHHRIHSHCKLLAQFCDSFCYR